MPAACPGRSENASLEDMLADAEERAAAKQTALSQLRSDMEALAGAKSQVRYGAQAASNVPCAAFCELVLQLPARSSNLQSGIP